MLWDSLMSCDYSKKFGQSLVFFLTPKESPKFQEFLYDDNHLNLQWHILV